MSDRECLNVAAAALTRHLKLKSEGSFTNILVLKDYTAGEPITTQNDTQHINHLYYVLWGELGQAMFDTVP